MVYAVVTGGGTSGHVIPARAILEALMEAGHSADDLRYVGTSRGIETELMKDFGVESVFLPISGLQRTFSIRNIARNGALPWRLFRSRVMARSLIKKWSPAVVVSVGGYASEPMARAAIAENVPLVCVSYDRLPGLATRRQAKHAAVCATAFEGVDLPRAVVTGAPVRAEIRHLNMNDRRAHARSLFGIPADAVMVTIVGGSLGSGALNALVPKLLTRMSGLKGTIAVYHVCGTRFLSEPSPSVPSGIVYQRVGYESRMADLYSATDVVIARAGASTVAEIATVGIASVLVPWSGAADNHQALNASWLAQVGGAEVATEEQCESGDAVKIVAHLLEDKVARDRLAEMARGAGAVHRSTALVEAIQNAAR